MLVAYLQTVDLGPLERDHIMYWDAKRQHNGEVGQMPEIRNTPKANYSFRPAARNQCMLGKPVDTTEGSWRILSAVIVLNIRCQLVLTCNKGMCFACVFLFSNKP